MPCPGAMSGVRLTPGAVRALVSHLPPRCWRWGQGSPAQVALAFPHSSQEGSVTAIASLLQVWIQPGWVEIRETWPRMPVRDLKPGLGSKPGETFSS